MQKLEVIVKTRTNNATGRKFKTYAVKTKLKTEDDKAIWWDCRFTKECKDVPDSHSYIYVDETKMNVDRSNKFVKLWIHSVDKIERIAPPIEDLSQYFE